MKILRIIGIITGLLTIVIVFSTLWLVEYVTPFSNLRIIVWCLGGIYLIMGAIAGYIRVLKPTYSPSNKHSPNSYNNTWDNKDNTPKADEPISYQPYRNQKKTYKESYGFRIRRITVHKLIIKKVKLWCQQITSRTV